MEKQRLAKINRLVKKLPANKQRQLLKQIQSDVQDIESQNEQIKEIAIKEGVTKGEYKKNEKPSDYAGIWKGKEIDARELRDKAWRRK